MSDTAARGGESAERAGDGADDALVVLESHGFGVGELTDEQREVLRGLSSQELSMMLDIKARLDEVGPEVQAHSEIAGGALF
ncbi:aroma-sacti cluster domain-containing protein [Streptomyces sp. NPDC088197]|uniref:aroma-sacti cluster domain-containing protein n=1 Tax=unclassified Streptomyces TaxID=2593676 RepID=UPI0033A1C411